MGPSGCSLRPVGGSRSYAKYSEKPPVPFEKKPCTVLEKTFSPVWGSVNYEHYTERHAAMRNSTCFQCKWRKLLWDAQSSTDVGEALKNHKINDWYICSSKARVNWVRIEFTASEGTPIEKKLVFIYGKEGGIWQLVLTRLAVGN